MGGDKLFTKLGVLLLLVAGSLSLTATLGSRAVHAASGSSFSFGAAGDYGAANTATATFTDMGTANLNFGLLLGDFSYSQLSPESAWCSYVQQNAGSLPFELISGNHEDGGDNQQGLIDNFVKCLPNSMSNLVGTYGQQYYFDYPAANPIARFILISPGLTFSDGNTYNYSAGGADYNWVSNAIDSARAQGIQWVIVGMHEVCLTSGGSSCQVGTDITNLLISKRVDMILDGHDHNYQRSKQIAFNGSTCTSVTPSAYNSACVVNDGSTGTYSEGAGTIIVTTGTGGIDDEYGAIYNEPDTPYFAVLSGTNLNPQKGFVKYTVSTSGISAQFIPSTTTSNFTDAFTIAAPGSTSTPTPTATPPPNGTIMATNFDSQSTGPLQTGTGQNQFTGANNPANLSVQNAIADSAPNSLSVAVKSGGGNYAYETYAGGGYTSHTLQFNVELGSDFSLPTSGDYMILAQTLAGSGIADPGKVSLVVTTSDGVYLDYFDSSGTQHFLWSSATLSLGSWHSISLQDVVGSGTAGSLKLTVDGKVATSGAGIDTGSQGIGYFALGDEYSPSDSGMAGHVYIDDVVTISGTGSGTATATPTSTPTPSPTATPTPSPTPTTIPTATPTPTPVATPTPTSTPSPTSTPTPTATPTPTPTPTPTGVPNQLTSINFDNQPTGSLQTGAGSSEFTGQNGSAGLTVENLLSNSAPNALSVAVSKAGGQYAYVRYSGAGYSAHTLQFSIQLGSDFVLPSADYMVLAQTQPVGGSSNAGKVSLILGGGPSSLHLDYFDSTGAQHYLYTNGKLTAGAWHTISLKEVVGAGSGSLALYLDGKLIGSVSSANTGTQNVGYYSVGDEYTPTDTTIAGHLYLDDVSSQSTTGQ